MRSLRRRPRTRNWPATRAEEQQQSFLIALNEDVTTAFPALRTRVTPSGLTCRIDDNATYLAVVGWVRAQTGLVVRQVTGGRTLIAFARKVTRA